MCIFTIESSHGQNSDIFEYSIGYAPDNRMFDRKDKSDSLGALVATPHCWGGGGLSILGYLFISLVIKAPSESDLSSRSNIRLSGAYPIEYSNISEF